jgi:2-keto-3-deoxy-L-rhamnonate aldolase RhmA
VDSICQIPGIDGIWIGPTDLAQSLGHLGNPEHPEVQAAIEKVIVSANQHGKPWGIPTGTVQDCEKYIGQGAVLMTLGSDSRLLLSGATDMVTQAHSVRGNQ